MTKSVVVTGVSGFIGKRIAKEMLDAGYRVRGTVRSDAKAEETRLALAPSDTIPSLLLIWICCRVKVGQKLFRVLTT